LTGAAPAGGARGRRLAIIGGGPVGLGALVRAHAAGWNARLYERGRVGENVRAWGHVRMFSPAALNEVGAARGAGGALLTGTEYVSRTLEPIAADPDLAPRILTGTAVVAVARDGLRKGDGVAPPQRAGRPFRLLLDGPEGERAEEADAVLDASGTFATPNWLGRGGVPAVGERALGDAVVHRLPDIPGRDRARFDGRRTVVVGAGHSAATAIGWLEDAAARAPGTSAVWVTRSRAGRPLAEVPDDPLPERARVAARANRLAEHGAPWLERVRGGAVVRMARDGAGVRVAVETGGEAREIRADHLLALVGYRPDLEIVRELQVHTCWATEGTYPLAAALLGLEDSAAADCLAPPPAGPESLRHPESAFYVVGAKSYGRNPNFLIRTGLQQVEDALRALAAPRA
jgi:thioredoxin reductase